MKWRTIKLGLLATVKLSVITIVLSLIYLIDSELFLFYLFANVFVSAWGIALLVWIRNEKD